MKHRMLLPLLLGILLLGCTPTSSVLRPSTVSATASAQTNEPIVLVSETPRTTPLPSPTQTPSPTSTPDPTPAPTLDPNRPMVALTFDDGPNRKYTEKVLDLLEQYGVKGTFFVVGSNINEKTQPLLQRMADLGCEIGMHGLEHADMTGFSTEENVKRFERMQRLISEQIDGGYRVRLMRPPYGSVNRRVQKACKQAGVACILWSVDTRDWSNKSARKIMKIVQGNTQPGAILLFHDRLSSTVEALEEAIPWLIDQGYDLVTVTELLESGAPIEDGRIYREKKAPSF